MGAPATRPDDLVGQLADMRRRLNDVARAVFRGSRAVVTTGGRLRVIEQSTEWRDAELVNGFTNAGAPYAPAAYASDVLGRVSLRGVVIVPSGDDGARPKEMFTLDEGYRPAVTESVLTAAENGATARAALVRVTPAGAVELEAGGQPGDRVLLDALSVRVI